MWKCKVCGAGTPQSCTCKKDAIERDRTAVNLREFLARMKTHKAKMEEERLIAFGREFSLYLSGTITLAQCTAACKDIDIAIKHEMW